MFVSQSLHVLIMGMDVMLILGFWWFLDIQEQPRNHQGSSLPWTGNLAHEGKLIHLLRFKNVQLVSKELAEGLTRQEGLFNDKKQKPFPLILHSTVMRTITGRERSNIQSASLEEPKQWSLKALRGNDKRSSGKRVK